MATVGKKFTSPGKWELAWFARLSAGQKLLWNYMWDRCDHAGVIEFIPPVWSAHISKEITGELLKELMEATNGNQQRISVHGDKVWLRQYIRFQQQPNPDKPISAKHPMLPAIVQLLQGHELYEEAKKADPVLFQEFEQQNGVSDASKASPSHGQGLGEASVSHGQALGESLSRSTSKSASNSGSASDSGSATPEPETKPESIYEKVRAKVNGMALLDTGDLTFQRDVDKLLEHFKESDVLQPRQHLLEQAAATDWNSQDWPEFMENIQNLQDLPF